MRPQVRFIKYSFFVLAFATGILTVYGWYHQVRAPYRLIEAAYQGDLRTVQRLLANGVSVHARDGWNSTALMYAASWGHLEIVQELLQAGAPINERARMDNTPLMFAAEANQIRVVKYLIAEGANLHLVNEEGKSAAELAEENGHIAVASLIQSSFLSTPSPFEKQRKN